jgi:hypothetical protein
MHVNIPPLSLFTFDGNLAWQIFIVKAIEYSRVTLYVKLILNKGLNIT